MLLSFDKRFSNYDFENELNKLFGNIIKKICGTICLLLALTFFGSLAFGEVNTEKANEAFSRGLEAYSDKRFLEAINWYTTATSFGHLGAPSFIGHIYVDGEGVPKNLTLAYMWYQIGATAGFKDSKENRDRIARMMDQESILLAKNKAKICIGSLYEKCK